MMKQLNEEEKTMVAILLYFNEANKFPWSFLKCLPNPTNVIFEDFLGNDEMIMKKTKQ